MKAKELLKALVKCGIADGQIIIGEKFDTWEKVFGKINKSKEYFCLFQECAYIEFDAKVKTPANEFLYLYQI